MTSQYPAQGPVTLRAHMADRPTLRGLRDGSVTSPLVTLDICGPKSVSKGFKPLVRDAAFDVSELSIMTYLEAKVHGKPLVLIPAVVLGRFQHNKLAYRKAVGPLKPRDLEGRRVGISSSTKTTVVWARAILQHQYGVNLDKITWVAYEDSHLAEFRDPPNVERFERDGRTLEQLLAEGMFDAAILTKTPEETGDICPLIADPKAAAAEWQKKFGAVPINHLFVVNSTLSAQRPDVVSEIYRMLCESKSRMPPTIELGVDVLPFGVDANRRNLELAIQYAFEQKLIPRRFEVNELFDDVTRGFRT